ncbi:MAG TPA: hypothetical protein PLR83_00445 [Pyrinomonadaceae bacterium]|nr:hypothetical protein [Pyrinomonadaceae bacterium]
MTKRTLAVLALFIFAVPAFADIARPDRTPNQPKKDASIDSRLTIRLDKDAREARLIIPRSELNELVAQLGTDGQTTLPAVKVGGVSQTQTIMGGTLISLAILFGGVWAFRSGKLATKTGKVAASVVLVLAGGALTSLVYANIAPPLETRSIKGSIFSPAIQKYKFVSGEIKLEVGENNTTPTLIVPDPAVSPTPSE